MGWSSPTPGPTADDVAVEENAEDEGEGDPASGGTEDEPEVDWSDTSALGLGPEDGKVTYVLLAPGSVTTA